MIYSSKVGGVDVYKSSSSSPHRYNKQHTKYKANAATEHPHWLVLLKLPSCQTAAGAKICSVASSRKAAT